MVFPTLNSSGKPIATAKLEFFARFRYWLVSGGMMIGTACGRTTKRNVCDSFKPTAFAASFCPLTTDCIPLLTISAIKAPVYAESPIKSAANSGERLIPPLKLNTPSTGKSSVKGLPGVRNHPQSATIRKAGSAHLARKPGRSICWSCRHRTT